VTAVSDRRERDVDAPVQRERRAVAADREPGSTVTTGCACELRAGFSYTSSPYATPSPSARPSSDRSARLRLLLRAQVLAGEQTAVEELTERMRR